MLEDLSGVVAIVLAVSLATERIVTIAKTIAPVYLAAEEKTATGEVDLKRDKRRRVLVLAISFLAAWITSTLLATATRDPAPAKGTYLVTLFGDAFAGGVEASGVFLPTLLLALLASGGSAFWTSILGYTSAVKDIRTQQRAMDNLRFRKQARAAVGEEPMDFGEAAGTTEDDFGAVDELVEQKRDELMALPHVVGLAVGHKEREGALTPVKSIVVFVDEKLQDVEKRHRIPARVTGTLSDGRRISVPTDVQVHKTAQLGDDDD